MTSKPIELREAARSLQEAEINIDEFIDVLIAALPEGRVFVQSLQGSAMGSGYQLALKDVKTLLTSAKELPTNKAKKEIE